MRILSGALWLIIGAVSGASAVGLPPLTAKEVGLMLRSGYSSDAVMRELSARHVAAAIDSETEKLLVRAGASQPLVDALKNCTYAVPPAEVAAAQKLLASQAEQRAKETERALKMNTLYQSRMVGTRSATLPAPTLTSHALASFVKGDLVAWKNLSLTRFDDQALEKKKLIALYFSAHWCAPCRKFTPQLVEYYNRIASLHPEFEIIFVSADRSPFAMETYMRETQMPWPAIDYQKVAGNSAIRKYAGEAIPCLVLVDGSGKVIADSYAGETYRGPQKVLAELDVLFPQSAGTPVALSQ